MKNSTADIKRILVVEDELGTGQVCLRVLTGAGSACSVGCGSACAFASLSALACSLASLVSIGIVDQEVANVIKENLDPSAAERRTGAFQNEQVAGFTDEELISSLTSLGLARKASEELCGRVPRNLSLDEAIKFALQNQS